MTRKILAVITAIVMCAAVLSLGVSALDSTSTPKGWEAHSIFDQDYAKIYYPAMDEETMTIITDENGDYEYELFDMTVDTLEGGKCYGTNGGVQFFNGSHLYLNKCVAIDADVKIEFMFRGTGLNVGTHYRCPTNTCCDVTVTVDGEDKTEEVVDGLNSIVENDTQEWTFINIDDLEYGDHIVVLTVNSTPRLHVDFFELRTGSTQYGVESTASITEEPEDTTEAATTAAEEVTTVADATTAADAEESTTAPAAEEKSSNTGLIIGIVAAVVVVIVVVVVIIVKKKK